MLTLLLLRHAKAVGQTGDDFARDLTDRGHADAGRLGAFLAEKGLVPDLALVSPAPRTRQTFEAVTRAIGHPVAAFYEPMLYNATHQQLATRLRDVDRSVTTLLIVGHNPGIMDGALALADSGDPQDFDAMRARFPPCSLVVIAFDHADWLDASYGAGRLDRFVMPDTLARGRS